MKKIGFLFGAGAEISYGMPSGGTFALDIFRQDTTDCKKEFKDMRSEIDLMSAYASEWLPSGFKEKNVGTFGQSVFENIIKDTIEHNRSKVINNLNTLDDKAQIIAEELQNNHQIDIKKNFNAITGRKLDNTHMNQVIAFTEEFKDGNKLFESTYFSSLLLVYKEREKITELVRHQLGTIIIAIIQLQIGALSECLARKINDSPFSKKDDDIDIFDDLGSIIQLNYSLAGTTGMEYLLNLHMEVPGQDDNERCILLFAQKLLESIFSNVIDYKSLVDSYWHYLYCPSTEWGKFCKICIFLLTVRSYIIKKCNDVNAENRGYYDDLEKLADFGLEISAIATTNYTNLISKKIKKLALNEKIHYLNGSTEIWYDPYVNTIGYKNEFEDKEKHFIVPLLFTQSGTKPMTSIHMLKEYVSVFDSFENSDIICVIGFGFNPDDEHINGILRELVDQGKKLVIIMIKGNKSADEMSQDLAKRLKTINRENIQTILVDLKRKNDDVLWIEKVSNMI